MNAAMIIIHMQCVNNLIYIINMSNGDQGS